MTTNRIAQLNDTLRTTLTGGRLVLSYEMQRLPAAEQAAILNRIRTYTAFTPGNDPYGEHDFGDLLLADGRTVLWQIDGYAPDLRHASEDPADTDRTVRGLTTTPRNARKTQNLRAPPPSKAPKVWKLGLSVPRKRGNLTGGSRASMTGSSPAAARSACPQTVITLTGAAISGIVD